MKVIRQKNFGVISTLAGAAAGKIVCLSVKGMKRTGNLAGSLGDTLVAHPVIPGLAAGALLGYGLHKLIQRRKDKRALKRVEKRGLSYEN